MAIVYYPSESTIYTRIVSGSNLTEMFIDVEPESIFVFTGSGLPFSMSRYVTSASWASSSLSSSWAITASYAMNGGGTGVVSGGSYNISASWASASLSASWAPGSLIEGYTYNITSSWASSSISSSLSEISLTSISASWASRSLSASWAPNTGETTLYTGSTYQITSSWASQSLNAISASWASASLSASWAPTTVTSFTSSNVTIETASITILTASNVTIETASIKILNASGSLYGTSSFAISASHAEWADETQLAYSLYGIIVNTASSSVSGSYPSILNQTVDLTPISKSHATIKVNNKLYGGSWNGYLYVLNTPDTDLTNYTTASLTASMGAVSQVCYSDVTNYLYFVGQQILKVDPNNISNQIVLYPGAPSSASLGTLGCICTYGNYLYVTSYVGTFLKIDINTGALITTSSWIDTSTGSVTVLQGHSCRIDDGGEYFYATSAEGYVAKVHTSNLAYTSSHLMNPFNGYVDGNPTDDTFLLGNYYYAANETGGPIWKISKTDLSWEAFGPYLFNSFGIWNDGVNIFNLSYTDGEVVIFPYGNLNTPVRFDVPGSPNELWITDGGKYIITDWNSTNIYDVSLPFVQVGINKIPSVALDVAGTIRGTAVDTTTLNVTNINYTGTIDASGSVVIGQNTIRATSFTGSLKGTSSFAESASYANSSSLSQISISSSYAPRFTLDELTDVTITTPQLDDLLGWNGVEWVNKIGGSVSAGSGVNLYLDSAPAIGGNQTLLYFPSTSSQEEDTASISNETKYIQRFITVDPIIGNLDGGQWTFHTYARQLTGPVIAGTIEIITRINRASELTGSVSLTGSGLYRTASFTGVSPLVASDTGSDASILTATLIQTPSQSFWITQVLNPSRSYCQATNAGYVNETNVTSSLYYYLFKVSTGDITTTTITAYDTTTFQPQYTLPTGSKIVAAYFAKSNTVAAATVAMYHGGTSSYTHITTPQITRHNDLRGLQGGSTGEYYHSTQAEYVGTGTGVFVRQTGGQITGSLYGDASRAFSSLSASWVSSSAFIITAQTASYISASNLPPHTSSWSINSLTASSISFVPTSALSASWVSASVRITTADTASYIIGSRVSGTVTSSISSSYATTASYAANANLSIPSGSSLNITASNAINSLTASYFYKSSGSGAWKIYVEPTYGDLVFDFS